MRRPETDWEQIQVARVRIGFTRRRPAESIEAEMGDEKKHKKFLLRSKKSDILHVCYQS